MCVIQKKLEWLNIARLCAVALVFRIGLIGLAIFQVCLISSSSMHNMPSNVFFLPPRMPILVWNLQMLTIKSLPMLHVATQRYNNKHRGIIINITTYVYLFIIPFVWSLTKVKRSHPVMWSSRVLDDVLSLLLLSCLFSSTSSNFCSYLSLFIWNREVLLLIERHTGIHHCWPFY